MSKEKVLEARLHKTTFVGGIGALKQVLDNNTYRGIEMELVNDHMLYVKHKNVFFKLPATNFENFVMAPEEPKGKTK